MIRLNYKRPRAKERAYACIHEVTVDGVVIGGAWLIRTGKRGVVKTYDVDGTGVYRLDHTGLRAAWKTLRGRVKIRRKRTALGELLRLAGR